MVVPRMSARTADSWKLRLAFVAVCLARWKLYVLSRATEVGMHAMAESRPIHRVYVDGFYMDKTDVTNEELAKFVKATGYV
jgi:formylglycine-generating enzyme required for sulfatase activity